MYSVSLWRKFPHSKLNVPHRILELPHSNAGFPLRAIIPIGRFFPHTFCFVPLSYWNSASENETSAFIKFPHLERQVLIIFQISASSLYIPQRILEIPHPGTGFPLFTFKISASIPGYSSSFINRSAFLFPQPARYFPHLNRKFRILEKNSSSENKISSFAIKFRIRFIHSAFHIGTSSFSLQIPASHPIRSLFQHPPRKIFSHVQEKESIHTRPLCLWTIVTVFIDKLLTTLYFYEAYETGNMVKYYRKAHYSGCAITL